MRQNAQTKIVYGKERDAKRMEKINSRPPREVRSMQQTFSITDNNHCADAKKHTADLRRSEITIFHQEYLKPWRQTLQYRPVLSSRYSNNTIAAGPKAAANESIAP